jgi:hypothetical protein
VQHFWTAPFELLVALLRALLALLQTIEPRLTPELFECSPMRPLHALQGTTNRVVHARIAGFKARPQSHVILRLELPTLIQPQHGAVVVGAGIARTGLNGLRKILLGLSTIASEIGMNSATINRRRGRGRLGKARLCAQTAPQQDEGEAGECLAKGPTHRSLGPARLTAGRAMEFHGTQAPKFTNQRRQAVHGKKRPC